MSKTKTKKDCLPPNLQQGENQASTLPFQNIPDIGFSNALNYLPLGICIINPDYTIKYINPAFSRLCGTSPEQAVQKNCFELFPSQFCHTPDCILNRVNLGEKSVQVEIKTEKPNGFVAYCKVSAFPLFSSDNHLIGVMEVFRDITEERDLEGKVREAEDRYKTMVDMTSEVGEGILMLQDNDGKEGEITFISKQCSRMLGYTDDELAGKNFFDLISLENREASLARHRRKMKGEAIPGLYQLNMLRKDGYCVPVEITSAITTYKGQTTNVVYLRDISSRKALESELSNEKEKYQTFFEEAPVALWELDYTELKKYIDELRNQGIKDFKEYFDYNLEAFLKAVRLSKLVNFNKAHRELWEMDEDDTGEDYYNKSVKFFYKDSDNFKALKDDFIRLAHGSTSFSKEETVQSLKGNRRYIYTRFTVAPGCENSWSRVFASLTDITERKIAELKLQESEKRWHTLFQSAPVAMWELNYSEIRLYLDKLVLSGVTDFKSYFNSHPENVKHCMELSGTVIDVNYAAYNLFEASSFLDFAYAIKSIGGVSSIDTNQYPELLIDLAEGKTDITFEGVISTAKGNLRTILLHYAVPPEQESTLSRVFVSAVDITAMKDAELELKAYQANLETIVNERTRQLNLEIEQRIIAENKYKELYENESRLRREMETLSENKIRYTRSLVHELRTPLTSLIASNDFLVENLTGQQKEFALAAQRSIIKLEHRVNELLDMSKGEVGLLELDYTEIDLNNFFDNLQPDLEAIIRRHKQHLILNIESNLPPIKGDTDRIQQVVFNLVDNALKFNPNNGSVIIQASQKSGEVVISVRDEGPGVEESNVPLLFEPYKGVKPTAQSMGGLGLGLPLSKMLVELHGGRIWFETQKDKGSLFSFSIPVISDNKENMAE